MEGGRKGKRERRKKGSRERKPFSSGLGKSPDRSHSVQLVRVSLGFHP